MAASVLKPRRCTATRPSRTERGGHLKTTVLVLTLFSPGFILSARAQASTPRKTIHRLEYIHFDTANQIIEWGISEGTLTDSGDYVQTEKPTAKYSLNVNNGVMKHDGSQERMGSEDADDTALVLRMLAQLMQTYTDKWNGIDLSSPDAGSDTDEEPLIPVRHNPEPRIAGPRVRHGIVKSY